MTNSNIENLAKLIRYYILTSTTTAGSGHPTSSLSGADLMAVLMFGGYFKADLDNPSNPNNDRLIFSKGHASPLFYALYGAAGKVSEAELGTLRKLGSNLEGHPTLRFPYTEAATGSLGQGLSVGLGFSLNAKYLDKLDYKTYVLLGDSEMAEGSIYEAMEIGSHYKLNNLVGIIDVNRLGQRGETMSGWDIEKYKAKSEAFGWETFVINGHNLEEIDEAFGKISESTSDKPKMIIAKTVKGKGVSFLENADGWHGKALKSEELEIALEEFGEINKTPGQVEQPQAYAINTKYITNDIQTKQYNLGDKISTRKAYGEALLEIGSQNQKIVALDAETSNSTFSDIFKKQFPDRFFEMFIAEQNMVSTALGLSRRGKIPFVSTFAAFFSRAFDQIRMTQYSDANIKLVGSHAGVSIGEDGSSQMALEDLAMFRTILGSVVLYPSDAVSTNKLIEVAAEHFGIVYVRTTRAETPVIYDISEEFVIGGSKTVKHSPSDIITVASSGITLFETLKAYEELQKEGINIRVIDLYSIKPIDKNTLLKAAQETQAIIVVEDHYKEGGIYSSICEALSEIGAKTHSLAVNKMSQSGKPQELLEYEEIDSEAIINKVKSLI